MIYKYKEELPIWHMANILKRNNLQSCIVGLGLKCLGTNSVTEKQQVEGRVGATGFVWFGAHVVSSTIATLAHPVLFL